MDASITNGDAFVQRSGEPRDQRAFQLAVWAQRISIQAGGNPEEPPEDRELRRALLTLMSGKSESVAPHLVPELGARDLITSDQGTAHHLTPRGREFLQAPVRSSEDVRQFMLATRQLSQVLAVGQEQIRSDGVRIVLTSGAIWDNEVMVHWTEIGGDQLPQRMAARETLGDGGPPPGPGSAQLSDDVGTEYQHLGGGASGGGYVADCRARFSGNVPAEARELRFVPRDTPTDEPFIINRGASPSASPDSAK